MSNHFGLIGPFYLSFVASCLVYVMGTKSKKNALKASNCRLKQRIVVDQEFVGKIQPTYKEMNIIFKNVNKPCVYFPSHHEHL